MTSDLITWLTGDDNPAVQYRTNTELLGITSDRTPVINWLTSKQPADWTETRGMWFSYYLNAFAECGLHADDVPTAAINHAFALTASEILDPSCETFLRLTALAKLGMCKDARMTAILKKLTEIALPDGGHVCTRIRNKLEHTPKSCYKANIHALFFLAACKKQGGNITDHQPIIDYFLNRRIFYRHDAPDTLVLNARPGWRPIDTFYPNEVMRIGVQNIVESFSALGYGNDPRLEEAWKYLFSFRDADGKYHLGGTLTKSYLPKTKEKEGKPSKWVTFYALLAEKEK